MPSHRKHHYSNGFVNNGFIPHNDSHLQTSPWHTPIPNGGVFANGDPHVHHVPVANGYVKSSHRKEKKLKGLSREENRLKDLQRQEERLRRERRQNRPKKRCLQKVNDAIISFLENSFFNLGLLVGSHPKKVIAVAVIVPLFLGLGLIRFRLDEDLGTLLLPPDSRFIQDRNWIEANINREERIINMIAKNENVLTRKTLLAMMDIVDSVADVNEGGVYYRDTCLKVKSLCVISSLLDLWQYNRTVIETLTQDEILLAVNTVTINPTYLTPINTTRMLGGVVRGTDGSVTGAVVTSMFWHHVSNPDDKEKILEIERKIIKLARDGHKDVNGLYVYTLDSYDDEFFTSVYGDLILLAFSIPLVIVYLLFNFGKPTLIEHGFPLMTAAMGGVILSTLTCYGVCLAAGLSYGATHQALVFLLVAIGVDDAFVIVEAMKRVKRRAPDEPTYVQVAMTMKSAGVSITVTSLSDVVAFATGISTRMPILSSFCVYSSVGVLALYIIQSTLFPACMALNEKRIQERRDALVPCYVHKETYKPNKWKDIEIVETFFTKYFGPAITTIPGKVIILLITVGMGTVMTWSLTKLEKGYDFQGSLRPESFSRQYLEINDEYFHAVGTGITVYCADVDLPKNLDKLEVMMGKYEKSEFNSFGEVTSWIPAFKGWLAQTNQTQILTTLDGSPQAEDDFYRLLRQFTNQSDYGAIFANDIHFYNSSATSRVKWTEFTFTIVYEDKSVDNDQNVETVRDIADTGNFTDGMCFANSKLFLFAEILKYVDVEILRNFILAGVAVFIVTLILIVNPLTSFFVLLCVIFTTLALGGVMQFWGYLMDGNMVILLTFCVGLAVDFSAHIGHMFMTVTGTRNERVRETISKIGPAVFHGGFSTFLGVSGLAFAKSYSLSLFFSTFLTVVIFGLFHGLCFLPVMLSLIGPAPYDNNDTQPIKWPENVIKLNSRAPFSIPRPKTITLQTQS